MSDVSTPAQDAEQEDRGAAGPPPVAVHAGGDDFAERPAALWAQAIEEGGRRLSRHAGGEMSTGLIGGVEVMLGVAAAGVVAGALAAKLPAHLAAIVGSLAFGVGFVFVTVGRSELFTENLLIPVGAVLAGRQPPWQLLRIWALTLITNLAGLVVLAAIFSTRTVLDPSAVKAVGHTADVLASRSFGGALLSAIVAGGVMTLWTWLTLAARTDIGRIAIALVIGFVIAAPVLNHVVVSTGEMMLGVMGGATRATWGDVWSNFGIALLGNLIGGIGFVTLSRAVQARWEQNDR